MKKYASIIAVGTLIVVSVLAVAQTPKEGLGSGQSQSNSVVQKTLPVTDFLLANLQNSQTLRVKNTSRGCFHSNSDIMEINQRQVRLSGNSEESFPDYSLSNKELTAIDKHLYWIKNRGGDGGCTTHQQLKLEIIENGAVVKSTEFGQNWCHYSDDFLNEDFQWDSVMDFADLSYKIRQVSEPRDLLEEELEDQTVVVTTR